MKLNDVYPSRFLSAADLSGREVAATIDRVELETFEQDRQQKPVAYFKGENKGLVLNKTNFVTIADIAGDDTDNWPGAEIVLYCAMVQFQGKTTEGIRVRRPPAPDTPTPQPSQSTDEVLDDDIPF